MIVSFEGGIGSGKSTIMEKVRHHFEENVDKKKCIITEDVDVWKNEGWLDLYYKDTQRYALGFQLRVLMSQHAMYSKMNMNHTNIVERCPLTNYHVFGKMLLHDGALHPLEYELSAETCMQRILRRSRDGEGSITMSYLKNMNTTYDDYIFNVLPKVYGISPIIIDAENDIDTVCQDIINVLP